MQNAEQQITTRDVINGVKGSIGEVTRQLYSMLNAFEETVAVLENKIAELTKELDALKAEDKS